MNEKLTGYIIIDDIEPPKAVVSEELKARYFKVLEEMLRKSRGTNEQRVTHCGA